jgi:hypothetical protein
MKRGRITLIALTVAVATAALGASAAPSGAAPAGGSCQLSGQAKFATGLNTTSRPFTYGFTGTLSNCVGQAGPASGGSVQAGGTWTDANGTFSLPESTGTGSCATSTTAGIAVIKWADGAVTIIKYTTTGAASAVALTGSVQPNLVLSNAAGQSTTISSTRYYNAGQQNGVGGQLAFHPADPTACNTPTGVTASPIDGFTQVGTS